MYKNFYNSTFVPSDRRMNPSYEQKNYQGKLQHQIHYQLNLQYHRIKSTNLLLRLL